MILISVYVCIIIKLHIPAQSGPVILVILCLPRGIKGSMILVCVCVVLFTLTDRASTIPSNCMVTHIARVWINRVRLPVLHVVS